MLVNKATVTLVLFRYKLTYDLIIVIVKLELARSVYNGIS